MYHLRLYALQNLDTANFSEGNLACFHLLLIINLLKKNFRKPKQLVNQCQY